MGNKMTRIEEDKDRERRIDTEILVDIYEEEPLYLGWYYYLENKMKFPFRARCIARKGAAPLSFGDEFVVSGMALEEECEEEMFVNAEWQGEPITVLLTHLEGAGVDEETREAIEDWHYWVGRGYEFPSQGEEEW